MTYQIQVPRSVKFQRNTLIGLAVVTCAVYLPRVNNLTANRTANSLVPPSTQAPPFVPPDVPPTQPAPKPNSPPVAKGYRFTPEQLWGNTRNHVLWRVVGAAEGTVTVDGQTTPNYDGHTDPGNFVHNRGAYSYQFGNAENLTPQESDKRQGAKIKALSNHCGSNLDEIEYLNCLDLINQAPLCVTESSGNFLQRLEEAKAGGLKGDEAILEARVKSFINPSTGRLDTNFVSEHWLRVDQQRRMKMIAQAIEKWVQEQDQGTKPTATAISVLFNSPYNTVRPLQVNNLRPNARGFRLSEVSIKASLWNQGRLDKALGLPAQLDNQAYQEGYHQP